MNNVFFGVVCCIGIYLVIKFIYSIVDIGFKIYEYITIDKDKKAIADNILLLPNWRDGDLFLQNHDCYTDCINHLCEYSFNALNAMYNRLRKEG